MMSNPSFKKNVRKEFPKKRWGRWINLKGWIAISLMGGGLTFGLWMLYSKATDTASLGKNLVSSVVAIQAGGSVEPIRESSIGTQQTLLSPAGNQLSGAASPYLREAALQPVHWLPWSEEAFHRAQQEDKPILLDIGAIWCHWCHVMDVESYENEEIARLINKFFVAIKVDMDERPDIDRRYQQAVKAISGSGGWPLTAFLTPQGKVFYGGTYFPREDRFGRPGLKTILPGMADAYKTRKDDVLARAEQLSKRLKRFGEESIQKGQISDGLVLAISTKMVQQFDEVNGGFGTGVKFPSGSAIELALAKYFGGKDPKMLEIVTKTLDAMAQGGVYDQIGGGFFRYSTDHQWKVPHFEKMNYDNAELLINYLHAYQATGKALYRETAQGIISYLSRVLSDQDTGGFYAHQDADMTREDDGDYYTWTVQEVRSILPKVEADVILQYYDIQPQGEMREDPTRNVPLIATAPQRIAKEMRMPIKKVRFLIDQGKNGLLQARMKRKTPLVDKTIYIDRNGMLISAYLVASHVLGNDQTKIFALKTLDLLLREAYQEGKGMYHAYFEGKARLPGFLNDQVQMAVALVDAFGITGEQRYLVIAKDLMNYAFTHFWDLKDGGFFDRHQEGESLAALNRPLKDIDDNPTSSANGVAIFVLDRLAYLTNNQQYEQKARETLEAFAGSAKGYGYFAAKYALAAYYHQSLSPGSDHRKKRRS